MSDTQTFIATIGTIILLSALLFSVAWIPWSVAAAVYRSSLFRGYPRTRIKYFACVLSGLALVYSLRKPTSEQFALAPPLGQVVDQAFADLSTSTLPESGIALLRCFVLTECVVALLLPCLIVATFAAVGVYRLMFEPTVKLVAPLIVEAIRSMGKQTEMAEPQPSYRERLQDVAEIVQEEHEAELEVIDSLPLAGHAKEAARNESERKLLRRLKQYVSPDEQSPPPKQ